MMIVGRDIFELHAKDKKSEVGKNLLVGYSVSHSYSNLLTSVFAHFFSS